MCKFRLEMMMQKRISAKKLITNLRELLQKSDETFRLFSGKYMKTHHILAAE